MIFDLFIILVNHKMIDCEFEQFMKRKIFQLLPIAQ